MQYPSAPSNSSALSGRHFVESCHDLHTVATSLYSVPEPRVVFALLRQLQRIVVVCILRMYAVGVGIFLYDRARSKGLFLSHTYSFVFTSVAEVSILVNLKKKEHLKCIYFITKMLKQKKNAGRL